MIGISLGLCIADIASGYFTTDKVEKIITRTFALTDFGWSCVVAEYCEKQWKEFPEDAAKIFRQLLKEGKIEQSRITRNGKFPMHQQGVHWVNNESEIVWGRMMTEEEKAKLEKKK